MKDFVQTFVAGVAGAVTVLVLIGASSIKTEGNLETDQQLVSNTQQTAPLVVQSATLVSNLNADRVDGFDASAFPLASTTYTMAEVDALLAASRDSRRAFYLTTGLSNGDQVDEPGVCDTGFHFASLFEILDVTSLRYDKGRGSSRDDAGQGPPSNVWGWVRTGRSSYGEQSNIGTYGDGGITNCDAWKTAAGDRDGTVVGLNQCWQEAADCGVEWNVAQWWQAKEYNCGLTLPAWCVEDYPGAGG